MRLIVGCPVAYRAWSIPHWMACLAAQSRRPDGFAFVHSGQVHDETWMALQRHAARNHFDILIHHDPAPAHPRHDHARFDTLGRLRNDMLAIARHQCSADLVLSLDTDVMLENPDTIARLEQMIADDDCDIAAPVTWMHPQGEGSYAYNAGWWQQSAASDPHKRAWTRLPPDRIQWGSTYRIDIPMAAWLGNQRALGCRYQPHESGEDLGYAQSLERDGLTCLWDTSLKARHIWSEQDWRLEQQAAAA